MTSLYRMNMAKGMDDWKCPDCHGRGTVNVKDGDRFKLVWCKTCARTGINATAMEKVADKIAVTNSKLVEDNELPSPDWDTLRNAIDASHTGGYYGTDWVEYANKLWDLMTSDKIDGTRAMISTKYNKKTGSYEMDYIKNVLLRSLLDRGFHGHCYASTTIFGSELNRKRLATDEFVVLDLDAPANPSITDKNSRAVDRVINSVEADCAIYLIKRYNWNDGADWNNFEDVRAHKLDELPSNGLPF